MRLIRISDVFLVQLDLLFKKIQLGSLSKDSLPIPIYGIARVSGRLSDRYLSDITNCSHRRTGVWHLVVGPSLTLARWWPGTFYRESAPAVWNSLSKTVLSSDSVAVFLSLGLRLSFFPRLSLLSLLTNTLPGPSASEVTTLWRYTNPSIIIMIIFLYPR